MANSATGQLIWSDEMYRIFGFEPGAIEVSADVIRERIHQDDRDDVLRSAHAAWAQCSAWNQAEERARAVSSASRRQGKKRKRWPRARASW